MGGDQIHQMSDLIRSPEYTEEQKLKIGKELQRKLVVQTSISSTYVVVTAYDSQSETNIVNRISCRRGIPIGGYVHDAQNDCYYVECADFLNLGLIPISYAATLSGDRYWKVRLPMPESVIKKYLSPLQKKELRNFLKRFKEPRFRISYIQMVDPN
jgi:hypothetical protein